MKKEMLINVLQPEECRIAILEDGVLEELYVERTSHESYVGNIYKGRIVNIEPSIQAAFVDFGVGRNGFLHVSDVEPAYYRHLEGRRPEDSGRRRDGGRDSGRDSGRGRQGGGGRPTRGRQPGQEQRRGRPHDRVEEQPPIEAPPIPLPEEVSPSVLEERSIPPAEMLPSRGPELPAVTDLGTEPVADAPEAVAEGAAAAEADQAKTRRRSTRGRSRRVRTEEVTEPAAEAEQTAAADASTERPKAKSEEADEKAAPEPPRPMDSAERRTREDDEELGPIEPRPNAEDEPHNVADASPPGAQATETPAALERWAESESDGAEETPSTQDEEDEMEEEAMAEERLSEFEEEEEFERGPGRQRDDRRPNRRNGQRRGGRPGMGRPKPLIQDIFKRGQEVLVQVIKEGIGTKGPTLSTYISIAGRYLVLMPGLNRIGVSRKIQDEEQRRRLREVLNELQPPKGLGFIIRTAGLDRNKKELQRDLAYLSRLWQVVVRRIRKLKSPAEIYQESDMITRTIRDTFTSEIDTIWVDEAKAFEHAQEFLTIVMPRYANRIKFYAASEPMFHKYGIEEEIARIQRKHVPLPNGGSIVIEQTEALVAIDVNSGNFRADNNAEETAYQMNLLAAREIARQLRLRDLGGVIVNDFIDMREEKHRRGVERAMRDAMKRDRARTKILKISAFGIIEMTRQRIRPSLKRSVYQDCPHCRGNGQVKTCESMSIEVMRMLQLAAHRDTIHRIQVRVQDEVANYLLNRKRKEVTKLEEDAGVQVIVSGLPGASPEFLEFFCYDNNNNEVKFLSYDEPAPRGRRR